MGHRSSIGFLACQEAEIIYSATTKVQGDLQLEWPPQLVLVRASARDLKRLPLALEADNSNIVINNVYLLYNCNDPIKLVKHRSKIKF